MSTDDSARDGRRCLEETAEGCTGHEHADERTPGPDRRQRLDLARLDGARLERALRGQPLGQRLLLGQPRRTPAGASRPRTRARPSTSRSSSIVCSSAASACRSSSASPTSSSTASARFTRRLSGRDRPEPVPGRLPLRLSDQGQPAAPGRRRGAQLRAAVPVRARSRVEAGTAGRGGDRRQRHADHLQRLQGRRVHRDRDAGPEDRPQHHPGGREVHRAGPHPRGRRSASACGRRSACA